MPLHLYLSPHGKHFERRWNLKKMTLGIKIWVERQVKKWYDFKYKKLWWSNCVLIAQMERLQAIEGQMWVSSSFSQVNVIVHEVDVLQINAKPNDKICIPCYHWWNGNLLLLHSSSVIWNYARVSKCYFWNTMSKHTMTKLLHTISYVCSADP